jgi:hypothetical protein
MTSTHFLQVWLIVHLPSSSLTLFCFLLPFGITALFNFTVIFGYLQARGGHKFLRSMIFEIGSAVFLIAVACCELVVSAVLSSSWLIRNLFVEV